jgi:hypothetical protein
MKQGIFFWDKNGEHSFVDFLGMLIENGDSIHQIIPCAYNYPSLVSGGDAPLTKAVIIVNKK